jgi:hypothetical protein
MKEDFLRRHLNKWPVSTVSKAARSRARHRSLLAFQQARSFSSELPEGQRVFTWKWVGWAALIVSAAVITIFLAWPQPTQENLASDRKMLRQMEALFPQQLDSVVEENGKINLSVNSTAMVGSDQPIVVVFRKNEQSIRVLSYSGHQVCVLLGKEHRCFDILATPSGGVLLVTNDQILNAQGQGRSVVAGYTVQALALEASL